MQALVLQKVHDSPILTDFKEPVATEEGQQILTIKAASLNPYDRYLSTIDQSAPPRVVGLEGIGILPDGGRVYFDGPVAPFGSIAEKSLINTDDTITLPADLADSAALTLGISGLAAWLPLTWKAKLQSGESVLILGATGAQGQIAVQAAKLLGAGHVVAAGRDKATLKSLNTDGIVVLEGDLKAAFKAAAPQKGYDVVIDSLFGEPFSALLESGSLHGDSRVVAVGGSAGQTIELGFRQLQMSKGASIAGYSTFYVPKTVKQEAYRTMAKHAVNGKLQLAIKEYPLAQATKAWQDQAKSPHKKVVITM